MMPLRRFTIHQPKTINEASQMLAEFGNKGRLYAGGTELLLAMKHDLLRYEHLVDVKTIPDLDKIETQNGALMIGSTATHRAIERSATVRQSLPVLADMETHVANVRVRASGTWAETSALPSRTPIPQHCWQRWAPRHICKPNRGTERWA